MLFTKTIMATFSYSKLRMHIYIYIYIYIREYSSNLHIVIIIIIIINVIIIIIIILQVCLILGRMFNFGSYVSLPNLFTYFLRFNIPISSFILMGPTLTYSHKPWFLIYLHLPLLLKMFFFILVFLVVF